MSEQQPDSKPGTTKAKPVAKASGLLEHRRRFYHRYLRAWALSGVLVGVALGLGILGYHFIAGFHWVDSLLNASMILSGMGPVGELPSDGAKVFASAYALFSGMVLITATGILLAPVFHWVPHRFHIEQKDVQ